MNSQTLIKSIYIPLLFLLLSCADEKSDEDYQRQKQTEDIQRLSFAEGSFVGELYLDDARKKTIPVVVVNSIRKLDDKPNNSFAQLESKLRFGDFGGVSLSSSSIEYDWGQKNMIASYMASPTAGGNFELEMLFNAEAQTDFYQAVLKTPRTGEFRLSLKKVASQLRGDEDLSGIFEMSVQHEGKTSYRSKLLMRRTIRQTEAPSSLDLPFLPPLEGAFLFEGMVAVPQLASQLLYNPLEATIEFKSRNNLSMIIRDVNEKNFPWRGESFLNGVKADSFLVTEFKRVSTETKSLKDYNRQGMPLRYFVGSYQGNNGGLRLKSFAAIEDLGSLGQNPSDYAFESFPDLRMTVVVCMGKKAITSSNFRVYAMDYLNQEAILREQNSSASVLLKHNSDWTRLNGQINDAGLPTSTGQSSRASFSFEALDVGDEARCDQL